MKATLYVPGQPAQLLTPELLGSFALVSEVGAEWHPLRADLDAVAQPLGGTAELLAYDEQAAVFGVEGITDNSPQNHEAETVVARLFGHSELFGPVLIIA